MEDVEMRWRVGRKSIVGVDDIDLPQFSLVSFNTLSTIQVLASGEFRSKQEPDVIFFQIPSLCDTPLFNFNVK